jgi:hypothetical protein
MMMMKSVLFVSLIIIFHGTEILKFKISTISNEMEMALDKKEEIFQCNELCSFNTAISQNFAKKKKKFHTDTTIMFAGVLPYSFL